MNLFFFFYGFCFIVCNLRRVLFVFQKETFTKGIIILPFLYIVSVSYLCSAEDLMQKTTL